MLYRIKLKAFGGDKMSIKKGFFEGILQDIFLAGAVEASRDASGKADPYKAAGIAIGMGHSSFDEQMRLATMLGADGAFDSSKDVTSFSNTFVNTPIQSETEDWRINATIATEYDLDPYDYDSEDEYLEAIKEAEEEAKPNLLIEDFSEAHYIPISIEFEKDEWEVREQAIKHYLREKYANDYPKIFLANNPNQSFYDIGVRALKSKATVELPFEIVIDVSSRLDIKDTGIFALLLGCNSKKQIEVWKKYSFDLLNIVKQCTLGNDDLELLYGLLQERFLFDAHELEIVIQFIEVLLNKYQGMRENIHFLSFCKETFDWISDGVVFGAFDISMRFVKLCSNGTQNDEIKTYRERAINRLYLDNEAHQFTYKFSPTTKYIPEYNDSEDEYVEMLVFHLMTSKDSKNVCPTFCKLLTDNTLTERQKRWVVKGINCVADNAASGYSDDEVYEYYCSDLLFKNALDACRNRGKLLGRFVTMAMHQRDMQTYRDIFNIYRSTISIENKLNKEFLSILDEALECYYYDESSEQADFWADYIEFDKDIRSIKGIERYKNIIQFCMNLEANYLAMTSKIQEIDMARSQYDALISKIKSICKSIESGIFWRKKSEKTVLRYTLTFPNGKHGDVNKYLASRCGELTEIDALHYSVNITSDHRDVLPLLICYTQTASEENACIVRFLSSNHYIYMLEVLSDELTKMQINAPYSQRNYFEAPESLWERIHTLRADYFAEITRQRNEIYQSLAKAGLLTSKWVSEYQVFKIISSIYPDAIYQYRTEWLEAQSLDVYIPSLALGVEYQGLQHYQAVDFFGGTEAFAERKRLDAKKKRLCKQKGVKLVEIKYTDEITIDAISKLIDSSLKI